MGVVMERWCPTQPVLGVFLRETEVKKKLLLAGTAALLMATSANASWVLIPGDTTDRNLHGCGSSYEICRQHATAHNRPTVTKANGTVPRFCYDLKTGKFTHWGPCRKVLLPTGEWVKVAH